MGWGALSENDYVNRCGWGTEGEKHLEEVYH